jgi:hypothetical protein
MIRHKATITMSATMVAPARVGVQSRARASRTVACPRTRSFETSRTGSTDDQAARLLGVPVGTYTHHAGSMHVNIPDLPRARAIVREAATRAPPGPAGPAGGAFPLTRHAHRA